MLKEFTDKIKKNAKIALYGAGSCAEVIRDYIETNRKDVEIEFFIDSYKGNSIKDGLKVINIKDFENYKNKIDTALITVRQDSCHTDVILKYFGIKHMVIPQKIESYIRTMKYNDKQKQALMVFETRENKELYNLLWDCKRGIKNYSEVENYVSNKYNISKTGYFRDYFKQYLEYINKDAIKTIYDGGFCNGIHALAFKKELPNLQKIYAFEPMYDKFKDKNFDYFLTKENFVEIIPNAMWDKECELDFFENTASSAASRVRGVKGVKEQNKNEILNKIKAQSIDNIRKEKNKKADFIKMDIEGSELYALYGAAETIAKDRPQLAISIYHSNDDFVNIPIYLKSHLKNYKFYLGHYSYNYCESVIYAIPDELNK